MPNPFKSISDFIFMNETLTSDTSADAIIIPGSHHSELATKAASLYHKGYAPIIIPTGAYNKFIPDYHSECQYLTEECLRCNVPSESILGDADARNTFENAKNTLMLLQNNSLPYRKIILVLKAFHSRRSLLTFQAIFPSTTCFEVAIVDHNPRLQKHTWFLHEPCIKIVMSEVEKIGSYFAGEITQMHKRYGGLQSD